MKQMLCLVQQIAMSLFYTESNKRMPSRQQKQLKILDDGCGFILLYGLKFCYSCICMYVCMCVCIFVLHQPILIILLWHVLICLMCFTCFVHIGYEYLFSWYYYFKKYL